MVVSVRRYLAYQNMHCPLQVPSSYEVSPSVIENEHARLEDAMAHALDDGVGNVTALLKSRGMWNDTILFFSVRCSLSCDLVTPTSTSWRRLNVVFATLCSRIMAGLYMIPRVAVRAKVLRITFLYVVWKLPRTSLSCCTVK